MSVNNLNASLVREIMDRLRKLETTAPVGYTSVTEGSLRIASNEGLIVEGSAKVTGVLKGLGQFLWDGIVTLTSTFTATGTAKFTGPFSTEGVTSFKGDTTQVGPFHVTGATDINGALAVKGAATLENNLTLTGAGAKITAGVVSLDSGGTLRSTNALLIVAVGLTTVQNNFTVVGNFTVQGAKAFKIPHPARPGYSLMHGSTESPVSGTEYWGTGTFDASGALVVTLPSYFEALNKPTGRAVIVSPIGRPFAIGADEIAAGKFTVYGAAGRKFTWLVKAERIGADFETESVAIEPDQPLNSVQ